MAHSYKDIIITPNRGSSSADPFIDFRGGNTTTDTQIVMRVYPDSNGTLSFEGLAGQLFSITNDLTGTIFAVNDVSGMPSLEIDASGVIRLAEFGGNILVGKNTDDGTNKLQVNGSITATNIIISGFLSANGSIGTNGQTLRSDGTKAFWSTEVGYTGSQGSQGVVGFTGSIGFSGSRGVTGFNGSLGFTGSKGALSEWQIITSNYTAINFDRLIVDSSTGTFSLTLPATPSPGNYIQITDGADLSVTNVTVLRNGSTIENLEQNVLLDLSGSTFEFIYSSNTWQVTATSGRPGEFGYTGSNGFSGSRGFSGSAGFTGSASTAAGPAGFTGSQGIQGVVGFTGSQGIQGVVGFSGSIGFSGSRGFTGSQGIQGVVGFTGSQGIQGVLGFTGSQGIQGVVGFSGSRGFTGSLGFTGSASTAVGPTGFTGSLGFTGSASTVSGPTGFTGSSGSSGTISASEDTSGTTHYPVFVVGVGNQTPRIRATATALSYVPSTGTLGANIFSAPTLTNAGQLSISATGANLIQFNTNGAERVRITSAGDVGIGTTSPSQRLEVNGVGLATTDWRAPIFYDSNNTAFYIDPASASIINKATFNMYREVATVATISSSAYTVDLSTSNIFSLTLGASPITFTFSNPPASGTFMAFTLILRQDGTGNRTVVYPAAAKFTDAVTPVLATAANKFDIIQFFTVDGGTNYIGAHAMANV